MEMNIKFNPTERSEIFDVLMNSRKFRELVEASVQREIRKMKLDKDFLVSLSHHLLKEMGKQMRDDK